MDHFSFVGDLPGDVLSTLGYQLNFALSSGSRTSVHSHKDYHSFERPVQYKKRQLEFTTQSLSVKENPAGASRTRRKQTIQELALVSREIFDCRC